MKLWTFAKDPNHSGAMVAIFTALIFLVNVIYTCTVIRQLKIMSNTFGLERPWIGPTGRKDVVASITDPITKKASKTFEGLEWHFQNGGRSPAVHTRINIVVKMGPPMPTNLDIPRDSLPKNSECEKGELGDRFGDAVVIPGVTSYSFVAPLEGKTSQSFDEINPAKEDLWLVGCVDYSDGTSEPWFRTNVLEYMTSDGTFAIWMTGNGGR